MEHIWRRLRPQRFAGTRTTFLVAAVLAATSACAHSDSAQSSAATRGGFDEARQAWEQNMVDYGHRVGDFLATTQDHSKRLNAQYYDGQWVFLRIADYTGNREPWIQYAELAEHAYKRYLDKNDYSAAGWMQFPHGLYVDWERYGDADSKQYLVKMREEAAFANPLRDIADNWYDQIRSREVAYSLQTQVLAAKAGAPPQPKRMERFVDMALNHIEIWTTGNYRSSVPERQYCQPFMTGLTASALISYYEYTRERGEPDERVVPAVRRLADWLWQEMWIANIEGTSYGAFAYVKPPVEDVGGSGPAPDLNMLIAPMYGWLYYRTGEEQYRQRGDAIFASGVQLADIGNGKRFNQSYRTSFDYLMWREAGLAQAENADWIGPAIARAPKNLGR